MPIIIVNGNEAKTISNFRQYDGEKFPGDLKNWDYFGSNPNEMLRMTYDVLQQRSTTLYHTHPPVASAVNRLTQYAIGSGLVFRSSPDWETLGINKEYAKDWSQRFQKLIHYMFTITNFYQKQAVLFRTSLIMGDALLFFDRAYDGYDGLFDLVETGGDYINFSATGTTLGIIHDKALRRTGLALTDGTRPNYRDTAGDQSVIQYYQKNMARQLRGFPLAYKIISHAKNNDRWWDATLARAVMETMILGAYKSDTSGTDLFNQSQELAAMAAETSGAGNNPTVTRAAGISDQLPGGIYSVDSKGGIEFTDLKTPSNNFDKMQNAYIDTVGMATGVPPEVILSRYSTSYTAHKGAFNDFIKSYMSNRQEFARQVVKVTINEFAKYLFLNNLIEMPNPAYFTNPIIREATIAGNYLGPVPGHINPAQEVAAKAEEVRNAFKLRSDVMLENGHEFDNMITEWQQEESAWCKMSAEQQAAALVNDMQQQDDQPQQQEDDNV